MGRLTKMGEEEIRVDIHKGSFYIEYFDGAKVVESRSGLDPFQLTEYIYPKIGNPGPKLVSCPGLGKRLADQQWRETIAEVNKTWRE